VQYGVSILRHLLTLLLLTTLLFASDIKTEQKIYGVIIHALLPDKDEIKVWSDTASKEALLASLQGVKSVASPKDADFVLLSKQKNISTDGIKFVTNFQLLESEQKSVVGGFFWQKGRPNILFLRDNLKKHNIELPLSMQEYVEDAL